MPESINHISEETEDQYLDIICPHCSFYMVIGKDDQYIRCLNCHTIHHKSDVKILTEEELLNNNMFTNLIRYFEE